MPVLVLIGPPGVGKTTVGKALGHRLGYQFFDADLVIEGGTGKTIPQIFQLYGESEFRRLESEILTRMVESKIDSRQDVKKTEAFLTKEKPLSAAPQGTVLATGAGMPVKPENFQSLMSLGHLIYLTAPLKVLVERLADSKNRPLLHSYNNKIISEQRSEDFQSRVHSEQMESRLKTLIDERQKIYEQAEITIDTDECSIAEVVQQIIDLLAGTEPALC